MIEEHKLPNNYDQYKQCSDCSSIESYPKGKVNSITAVTFMRSCAYTDSGDAPPSQSKSEIDSSEKIRGKFTYQTHPNNNQNNTIIVLEIKSRGLTDNKISRKPY